MQETAINRAAPAASPLRAVCSILLEMRDVSGELFDLLGRHLSCFAVFHRRRCEELASRLWLGRPSLCVEERAGLFDRESEQRRCTVRADDGIGRAHGLQVTALHLCTELRQKMGQQRRGQRARSATGCRQTEEGRKITQ